MKQFETWVGLLVFFCFGFDALALSFAIHQENNLGIYNIAIFVETSLLFYIYYHLIASKTIRFIIRVGYPLFVAVYLLNFFVIQKFEVLNTYTYVPAMGCVALLAFIHLRQCIELLDENPLQNFFFWFSVANLIDYTVSAPLIGTLSWFAFENENMDAKLYLINNWIYVTWFAILCIGLLWTKKQPISPSL